MDCHVTRWRVDGYALRAVLRARFTPARFSCAGRIFGDDADQGKVFVPQLLLAWKRLSTAVVVGRLNVLCRVIGLEACEEGLLTRR